MIAISLQQRVAWAWLDKMVGRTPVPGVAVSPKERSAALNRAYEQLKDMLIEAVRAEIPLMLRAEEAIAVKYGIDPVFLDWFLINGKHWPPASPKHRRALRTMQSILIWYAAVPSSWNNMVVPDAVQGDDRDAAMLELADWFLKNSFARVERKFTMAVWKKSRELLSVLGTPQGNDSKMSALLLSDFTTRLVADAFQLKPVVQQIVDLMH